jgi:hypothetical protein
MDILDVRLHDDELHREIQLVAALMIAANLSEGPLCPLSIDAALGLTCASVPSILGPHEATPPRSTAARAWPDG